MVGVPFVLFVPTTISKNGGSYTIDVLIEIHAKIILIRNCLTVRCLFTEVGGELIKPEIKKNTEFVFAGTI